MTFISSWWDHFFSDHFADLILERSEHPQLDHEVDFITHQLQLKPGDTIFDQCCGTGEISCALAKMGITIIGVDLSESYIARARKKAKQGHLPCTFHQADALEFICPTMVDGAINWFTSFGYSNDDKINLKMLENSYLSLKNGGRFLLDYNNPAFIFANFKKHTTHKKILPEGEVTVFKESIVDLERGMFISKWQYVLPNGEQAHSSGESRIYFARDLIAMLTSCGFKIINIAGDMYGASFSLDSPRCIITAEK